MAWPVHCCHWQGWPARHRCALTGWSSASSAPNPRICPLSTSAKVLGTHCGPDWGALACPAASITALDKPLSPETQPSTAIVYQAPSTTNPSLLAASALYFPDVPSCSLRMPIVQLSLLTPACAASHPTQVPGSSQPEQQLRPSDVQQQAATGSESAEVLSSRPSETTTRPVCVLE